MRRTKTFEGTVQQIIYILKVNMYLMRLEKVGKRQLNELGYGELYDFVKDNSIPQIEYLFNSVSEIFKKNEINGEDENLIIRRLRLLAGESMFAFNILNFRNFELKETAKRMVSIYRTKNADYGNSFDQSLDEDGLLVAKIRIGDKVRRFLSLTKEGVEVQVKEESISDTLLDLANYCVMTIVYINNHKN